MSEQPPSQPQISADGKFYWDGQKWVPMVPAATAPAPARRRYPGRSWLALLLPPLVLIAGGVLVVGLTQHSHNIKGTMVLHETGLSGTSCTGTGGYSDIHAGTQVSVRDESAKLLATSQLGEGTVINSTCTFAFRVSNVPDANFYQVEVSHRGGVSYPKADMDAQNWEINVELGA